MPEAIEKGDLETVKAILAQGYYLESLLEHAEKELQPNGDILSRSWECTSLHLAVRYNKREIVDLFYRVGANMDADLYETLRVFGTDGQQKGKARERTLKPSAIALEWDFREMTLLLNKMRRDTKTLKEAVVSGSAKEVAACLHNDGTPPDLPLTWTDRYVEKGMPSLKTYSGTLLHYAVVKQDMDKIRVLVAFGAEVGRLVTVSKAEEDLLTGKVVLVGDKITTSTLSLASQTGNQELRTLIETAFVAEP